MFTGIIEAVGRVGEIEENGSNKSFWVSSPLSDSLKIDQSIAHNGVCLTVEAIAPGRHKVTAIDETLQKTHIGNWQTGTAINLERCVLMGGRLDGHIVQGHVDTTGTCLSIQDQEGSWLIRFSFDRVFAPLVIEKGSICLNGISLTIFNVSHSEFSVGIIPFTRDHTNIRFIKPGDSVNLEFDMVGKYIQRSLSLQNNPG